jgi:ribosome-binding factor A
MSSHRILRVRELLKRAIGEAIRREMPLDQTGLVTVNDVEIGGDLRAAKVFIGILGSADQQRDGLAMLQKNRTRIQSLVAKSVILKYTPQLRFVVDDSVTRGNRVLDILTQIDSEIPPQPDATPEETPPASQ